MKTFNRYNIPGRKPLAAKNGGRFSRWLNSPRVKPWILWILVSVLIVILTPILSGIIFLLLNVSAYIGIGLADGYATSTIAHVEWTITNLALVLLIIFAILSPYLIPSRAAETAVPLSVILSIPIGITAFIVFGLIF